MRRRRSWRKNEKEDEEAQGRRRGRRREASGPVVAEGLQGGRLY